MPSRYQHGSVFHAGGLDGVPANAAAAYGRCRCGHYRSCLRVDIGGEGFAERVGVEVQVSALGPVRPRVWHGPDRGPKPAAFEPLEELLSSPSSPLLLHPDLTSRTPPPPPLPLSPSPPPPLSLPHPLSPLPQSPPLLPLVHTPSFPRLSLPLPPPVGARGHR